MGQFGSEPSKDCSKAGGILTVRKFGGLFRVRLLSGLGSWLLKAGAASANVAAEVETASWLAGCRQKMVRFVH